jgi:hypothetical protein
VDAKVRSTANSLHFSLTHVSVSCACVRFFLCCTGNFCTRIVCRFCHAANPSRSSGTLPSCLQREVFCLSDIALSQAKRPAYRR